MVQNPRQFVKCVQPSSFEALVCMDSKTSASEHPLGHGIDNVPCLNETREICGVLASMKHPWPVDLIKLLINLVALLIKDPFHWS